MARPRVSSSLCWSFDRQENETVEKRTLKEHIGRFAWRAVAATVSFLILFGCGGGGGGPAPANLTGRILLLSSGSPISGATVMVGGSTATTTVDGMFTLNGISSTSTQVTIKATGVKDLVQNLPVLTPNATNDLGDIFVLGTSDTGGYDATVTAHVLQADTQAPVVGARVRLNGLVATTDGTGAFTLTGLPAGLGGTLTEVGKITATGLEDKPIVIDLPIVTSPPINDLGNILMNPPVGPIPGGPANVKGRVLLQGRTDYSGTTVNLINKSNSAIVATVTTVADGKYGFWVPVGNYTVSATQTGFQTKTQDTTLTKLDQPVTVPDITLTP